MNAIRWRRGFGGVVLLTLLFLSITIGTVYADPKPQSNAYMPDVLIWIDARNQNGHWVSITYPVVVKREKAEKHLTQLLNETGWSVLNLKISSDSVLESGENPMTSVEFQTPAAIDLSSGNLPVEPIIKALKDLKKIEIHYLTQPGFQFQGLENYENKYVKIAFGRGERSYRYSIDVKNSKFDTLNLPIPNTQKQAAKKNYSNLIVFILVSALALTAAILTYAIISNVMQRNSNNPRRRS